MSTKKKDRLIRNQRSFAFGMFLAMSFIGMLILIFTPIYGDGRNGLEFSDDVFNALSKGSSNFLPAMEKSQKQLIGKNFSDTIKLKKSEEQDDIIKILSKAGANPVRTEEGIKISSDLGQLLGYTIADSKAMFYNKGEEIAKRYDLNEKQVMKAWWNTLVALDIKLKKIKMIEEANIVSNICKKAIEPAFNYYGIEAKSVTQEIPLMVSLQVFYVIYTMWWGFALFFLFEGIGLTMKRMKKKTA